MKSVTLHTLSALLYRFVSFCLFSYHLHLCCSFFFCLLQVTGLYSYFGWKTELTCKKELRVVELQCDSLYLERDFGWLSTVTCCNLFRVQGFFVFSLMLFSRYVLECAECGIIYRSRQYWFGNDDPVNTVVRTELCHAWPGVRFRILIWHWRDNVKAGVRVHASARAMFWLDNQI